MADRSRSTENLHHVDPCDETLPLGLVFGEYCSLCDCMGYLGTGKCAVCGEDALIFSSCVAVTNVPNAELAFLGGHDLIWAEPEETAAPRLSSPEVSKAGPSMGGWLLAVAIRVAICLALSLLLLL